MSSTAYDENHCLKEFNELAIYHNRRLQYAIYKLKQEKPNALIVYGDYYNAYKLLLRVAKYNDNLFETQLGGDFNLIRMFGVNVRDQYKGWGGVRLTQLGYELFARDMLIDNIFSDLQCDLVHI